MNLDATILSWLNGALEVGPVREAALWLAVYGLLVFVVVALIGWFWPRERVRRRLQRLIVLGVMSAMLAIVFEQVISVLYFRARPFTVIETLTAYDAFVDSTSFPSLHTALATAFAGAWLWARRYRVGFSLLGLALLIGLSRVIIGVHYPSDIIGGLASGLLASWLVARQAGWLSEQLDDD